MNKSYRELTHEDPFFGYDEGIAAYDDYIEQCEVKEEENKFLMDNVIDHLSHMPEYDIFLHIDYSLISFE